MHRCRRGPGWCPGGAGDPLGDGPAVRGRLLRKGKGHGEHLTSCLMDKKTVAQGGRVEPWCPDGQARTLAGEASPASPSSRGDSLSHKRGKDQPCLLSHLNILRIHKKQPFVGGDSYGSQMPPSTPQRHRRSGRSHTPAVLSSHDSPREE